MYAVCITGSRKFLNKDLIATELENLYSADTLWQVCPDLLIVGDAIGADSVVKEYCESYDIAHEIFYADWDKFGKSAGHIRNDKMLALNPNLIIAFGDGESPGTKSMIEKALKQQINLKVLFNNG